MSQPRARRRTARAAAVGVVAAATAVGIVALAGGPGAAAANKPLAQSVGNFLDGALAGMPIQEAVVGLDDARAVNPGTTTAKNQLNATLLGQINVPIGDALHLPDPSNTFEFGAVNQIAVARSDGYSFGASGAVSNQGGVSIGGSDDFPANATVHLGADSLAALAGGGLPKIPIPGLPGLPDPPDAAALGSIDAVIGGVSGLAQTKAGGDPVAPQYQIAGLGLSLGSPALGALLQELAAGGDALSSVLGDVFDQLNADQLGLLPAECTDPITGGQLPDKIELPKSGPNQGAITIDPANALISVDLAKILALLELDLNHLPANTDLLGYLLGDLPQILGKGLLSLVTSITDALATAGQACIAAFSQDPVLGLLAAIITQLQDQQDAFVAQLGDVADMITDGTADPLAMLTAALAKALAIGVNVESGPGKIADNEVHPFSSALQATPNQTTPVVEGQTLVRAIEVDLGGAGGIAIALGNAAAGPSSPAVAPPTTAPPTPSTSVPNTAIPTGVPAGLAETGATPTVPLVLLALGLVMAGGAAVTWRLRGTGGQHS